MKFIDFMEKRMDPFIKLSLTDLAKTLAEEPDLIFDYSFYSTYRPYAQTVTASHYWSRLLDPRKKDGMKSDVYLRAYGNYHFTDYQPIQPFWKQLDGSDYPLFFKQVFSLIEDFRLERLIVKKRPGMSRAFSARHDLFQKRFRERFSYHFNRNEALDQLFCAIYLQFIERPIVLPHTLAAMKPAIREMAHQLASLSSTEESISLTKAFLNELPSTLSDMHETYFLMDPFGSAESKEIPFPGEKNALVQDRKIEIEQEPDADTSQEQLPTWHADQDQEGDSFLQFDLDEGAASDLMGEGERKAESGDQAFASLEGTSKKGEGNQFDELPPTQSAKPPSFLAPGGKGRAVSDPNRLAKAYYKKVEMLTPEMKDEYRRRAAETVPAQKALMRSIQKLIEHKQQAPRNDLHVGRLGKKLLRIVTDPNSPRLFYKKQAESQELDVVFSLLVDCSASMHDKMEETKNGITLFHESLRALHIPHAVIGFWEDALKADETHQPNYFFEVIPYETSLFPGQGASILQLQPEEDNRDGFAIRETVKKLVRRPEMNKLLLVFTDGEPSAFNYQEQGIVDTHEAVLEARKRGIEVIGVLLADTYTQDSERETLKNIYGRSSLVIPSAEEIPTVLTPLLRKLLAKYI
ncbi:hypothetical protein PU629_17175 [Pullulanibacillus sp. KACC 23026]|uniref:vWA domain-containing protein n=1 Tax=Pullulanibacillus sp. KACC 23026 TaxID=3028315 RepID=UPI0023B02D51|nr:hypothetical protein [Pullulanibacillus sp. KACC 23026]WEG11849.1 hypothetical protein PU629_17175 [Pullulanibacillus sp. KACC 23026]